MPGSRISLVDAGRSLLVRYGDFVSANQVEWTNHERLECAFFVTAGTRKGPLQPVPDPFGESALLYPDEATEYRASQVSVTDANAAALLATDFSWTEDAARTACSQRIPAEIPGRIRDAMERLRRRRLRLLRILLKHSPVRPDVACLFARVEEPLRGIVKW